MNWLLVCMCVKHCDAGVRSLLLPFVYLLLLIRPSDIPLGFYCVVFSFSSSHLNLYGVRAFVRCDTSLRSSNRLFAT